MPRLIFLGTLAAGVLLFAFGQERNGPMTEEEKAVRELTRIEEQFPAAVLNKDAAMLEKYTADDFLGIDHVGRDITKAQVLARLDTGDFKMESLRHDKIRVRVFGDCAVATAVSVIRGSHQGQVVEGQFPYLRVWVKRAGRWQAVAAQSAMIPKGSS